MNHKSVAEADIEVEAPRLPQHTVSIPVPTNVADPNGASSSQQAGQGMDEEGGSFDAMGRPIPTEQLFVKDAFLVFRALCKLTMKPLVTDR